MPRNKLYNQSYFIKRIVECGYDVTRLNVKFETDDSRRWMILVNSKILKYKFNICITCFKVNDEFMFKFQGQSTRDFTLNTKSMTTILNILDDVIGKAERKENETNE
jgi:hypothetical protein